MERYPNQWRVGLIDVHSEDARVVVKQLTLMSYVVDCLTFDDYLNEQERLDYFAVIVDAREDPLKIKQLTQSWQSLPEDLNLYPVLFAIVNSIEADKAFVFAQGAHDYLSVPWIESEISHRFLAYHGLRMHQKSQHMNPSIPPHLVTDSLCEKKPIVH